MRVYANSRGNVGVSGGLFSTLVVGGLWLMLACAAILAWTAVMTVWAVWALADMGWRHHKQLPRRNYVTPRIPRR